MVDDTKPDWIRMMLRVQNPQFLCSPYFIRSFIAAGAFGYGVHSISACLLMKRNLPVWRGGFISVPAFSALLSWYLSREDPIFVYNS